MARVVLEVLLLLQPWKVGWGAGAHPITELLASGLAMTRSGSTCGCTCWQVLQQLPRFLGDNTGPSAVARV